MPRRNLTRAIKTPSVCTTTQPAEAEGAIFLLPQCTLHCFTAQFLWPVMSQPCYATEHPVSPSRINAVGNLLVILLSNYISLYFFKALCK